MLILMAAEKAFDKNSVFFLDKHFWLTRLPQSDTESLKSTLG